MTREPTEMELRVAGAMYEDALASVAHVPFAEYVGRENWIKSARAAIRAMREPTQGMLGVLRPTEDVHPWRAMIDAASPEEA